jgi:hypothetical protein
LQNHTGNRKRNGNLANDLKENQQDYTGLEYSQSMIAIAEKNENCTFIWGYADFNLEKSGCHYYHGSFHELPDDK